MATRGRFRKVYVRVWRDEKFRALTKVAPSGQALFLHLLTSPRSCSAPGLIEGTENGMAADLKWTGRAFRKAFGELSRAGMALADWPAGLVWLPKAIEYNEPESPNVIRSWGKALAELPECGLKTQALEQYGLHVLTMGEGFRKAFRQTFPEALAKVSPNQDQDQEQEQESPPSPPRKPRSPSTPSGARASEPALTSGKVAAGAIVSYYVRFAGSKPADDTVERAVQTLIDDARGPELWRATRAYVAHVISKPPSHPRYITTPKRGIESDELAEIMDVLEHESDQEVRELAERRLQQYAEDRRAERPEGTK
jgi:hypothetical protein